MYFLCVNCCFDLCFLVSYEISIACGTDFFTKIRERPFRRKLPHIATEDDVVELIQKAENIIVITGAGISVSCGIPDFRSKGGVYDQLAERFDLTDSQLIFDLYYFKSNPLPFYQFAREIYPGRFKPSLTHYFIKELERRGKLLRNYTQNIDCLEDLAGIKRKVECHGSFQTASCLTCGKQVSAEMTGAVPSGKVTIT